MCLCSQSQENCRFVPTTLTTSDTVTNGGTAQTSSCSAQTGVTRSQTPTRNRTTSEWVEFIQGLEQESILGELEGVSDMFVGISKKLVFFPAKFFFFWGGGGASPTRRERGWK